ncbi:spindle and centriole-associated protein 1-like isoform X2 [Haliotis rufescens]|uniref:spindle and centriole-associated protein 1-like isoform X2 n=1 Tax=Haliotis rufescens TaxID=6454 RepID=UPI00201EADAF|nr:spindle and centriole-associated protein 1-like isoform X2 [Haliotis rufescens]
MSFVRPGHKKKRVVTRKKPIWDDSLNDLSVFKPSAQELVERHVAHKSKNHMTVKLEKMRKAKQKNTSLSNAEARQMAIMKEVLYDQQQLHDTLSKSDKMMAVVKDLFGDDPRRFLGIPNVTSVPGQEGTHTRTKHIVAPVKDIRTKSETMSESVMDQVALNDFTDSESDDGDAMEPIVYQPQMNLQRFQQFLAAEEERNQTLSSIGGQAQLTQNASGPIQSTRLQSTQDVTGCETPKNGHNESIEMLRTPRSAINDTRKVKKTKKRVSPQKENRPQTASALNLTDLRKVLGHLENEIEEYEKQTGRRPPAEKQRSETFSGYTVALVDSVSKLATYLRETDLRIQAEVTVREQLTQDVFQLRHIVDTLTSDIIVTQEDYGKMLTSFERYRSESKEEINRLKLALQETVRLQSSPPEGSSAFHTQDGGRSHTQDGGRSHTQDGGRSHTQDGGRSHTQDGGISYRHEHGMSHTQHSQEAFVKPASTIDIDTSYPGLPERVPSHAVVLSPPIRKTRVTDGPEPQPAPPKRQTSLIDISTLSEPVASRHLPPHTARSGQPPPQVATVSVPRPAPLVQSNLPGGSLSTSGHYHPTQSVSMQVTETSGPMSAQIAELNRQHEEAQKRLQILFQQQERQHMQMVMQQQQKFDHQQQGMQQLSSDPQPVGVSSSMRPGLEQGVHGLDNISHAGVNEMAQFDTPPKPQAQSRIQGPISPPISPISYRSDNFTVLQHLQDRQRQYGGGTGREITVSLPVMDLEISGGSPSSPRAFLPGH